MGGRWRGGGSTFTVFHDARLIRRVLVGAFWARQPFEQALIERFRINRFGQKVIHPRFKAIVPVFVEGVGRHRYDGGLRSAGHFADRQCGVKAVHYRHLHVHQDQVVGRRAYLVDGFPSVFGGVHLQADSVQEQLGHLKVEIHVIGQQDF